MTDIATAIETARACLEHEDSNGALRALQPCVAGLDIELAASAWPDVYRLLARTLTAKFGAELGDRAQALADAPASAAAAYALAHALVDRTQFDMAAGVAGRAHAAHPGDARVAAELIAALQLAGRHDRVTATLDRAGGLIASNDLIAYLEAFNAMIVGDVGRARRGLARLDAPAGGLTAATLAFMRQRVADMVCRYEWMTQIQGAPEIERADRCAWHYVRTAGTLAWSLRADDPTGDEPGPTWDTDARVVRGASVIRDSLAAWGCSVDTVLLPPDRGSQIFGRVLAELLDAAAVKWSGTAGAGLVAVYDTAQLAPELMAALVQHRPGQLFCAHTASAVAENRAAPDLCSFRSGRNTAPWGPGIARDNQHIPPRPGTPRDIADAILADVGDQTASAEDTRAVELARALTSATDDTDADARWPAALRDSGQREPLWRV